MPSFKKNTLQNYFSFTCIYFQSSISTDTNQSSFVTFYELLRKHCCEGGKHRIPSFVISGRLFACPRQNWILMFFSPLELNWNAKEKHIFPFYTKSCFLELTNGVALLRKRFSPNNNFCFNRRKKPVVLRHVKYNHS